MTLRPASINALPHGSRDGERGFTLVEVLIALAIIAAMAGVTFEAIAQDARARSKVRLRQEALLVARSALDRAAAGDRIDSGRSGTLWWRVERHAYAATDPLDRHSLEEVTVSVDGDEGKSLVTLSTVRIAR
jgi:prepilin-type N-terminal cleavage/methylation domain-containing protein